MSTINKTQASHEINNPYQTSNSDNHYRIINNRWRSGPPGSLARHEEGKSAPPSWTSSPESCLPVGEPLPSALHISFSTNPYVPTTIHTSKGSSALLAANLHTQVVQAPHVALFDPVSGEEYSSATIGHKYDSISYSLRSGDATEVSKEGGKIGGKIIRVSASRKLFSKGNFYEFDLPPSLKELHGDTLTWRGTNAELACVTKSGHEVAHMRMEKRERNDDWAVKAVFQFERGSGNMGGSKRRDETWKGRQIRDLLLLTGLTVQHCMKYKGRGFWDTLGTAGMVSGSI